VDKSHFGQDSEQWQVLVNSVMGFSTSIKVRQND
jgi:hypothetical protein